MTSHEETPMPEPDNTPPSKPHRQVMVVFDLTSVAHREILRVVAHRLCLCGQADKAAGIQAYLETSTDVLDLPSSTEIEAHGDSYWGEYFDGADPAAGWPAQLGPLTVVTTEGGHDDAA